MAKVLIVDDEPNIVMALEYALKKSGFEVFIALNGKEAIDICQKQIPCVMILDIMMPNMDGYEVLDIIRQDEKMQPIKTIFLSAKDKTKDIEKGLQAGAEDYVTKPFSTKKLIDKIAHLCKN